MNSHQRRKTRRADKRNASIKIVPLSVPDLMRCYMQPAVQAMATWLESDLVGTSFWFNQHQCPEPLNLKPKVTIPAALCPPDAWTDTVRYRTVMVPRKQTMSEVHPDTLAAAEKRISEAALDFADRMYGAWWLRVSTN